MNGVKKSRVLLLNTKSLIKIINNKNSFVNLLKSIIKTIDKIDNDKEVMNSSEMINLEKRKIINYKNSNVEKFHHDVLSMIENENTTNFLIFKN